MTQTLDRPTTTDGANAQADDELVIRDLHVVPVADRSREILQGIDLTVRKGEVHAIMGRNGSGKTTLAYALMGHPAYEVTKGEVIWKGQNLLKLSPDKRARTGIFLAFQYPTAVPGLSVASFLRTALNARMRPLDQANDPDYDPSDMTRGGIKMGEYRNLLREKMALLKLDDSFAARYVNEGFSGGEKKRLEMLQMAVLQPEIAILDETDSGLDIDALRIVAEGVNAQLSPELGSLADHALPAHAQLHQAGHGPRPCQGQDRGVGRTRARAATRGRGLRSHPARGRFGAGRPGDAETPEPAEADAESH